MPAPIATNLPTVMQAVETQLLTYVTADGVPVCADLSNIYWVMAGEAPPQPGTTGQRDVLLVERTEATDGSVQGGGRIGAWMHTGLDVYLRSSYAADRVNTRKQWLITHADLVDGIKDALMGFFPEDANHNALTIEGFILDTNAAPVRDRSAELWGYSIATYRFHLVPNIQTTGNI